MFAGLSIQLLTKLSQLNLPDGLAGFIAYGCILFHFIFIWSIILCWVSSYSIHSPSLLTTLLLDVVEQNFTCATSFNLCPSLARVYWVSPVANRSERDPSSNEFF